MNTSVNQVTMFGTLIKEDVWVLKLKATKGNEEKYIESFEADINEWLKDIPDRRKVEQFKSHFYSSLFDTRMGRGIYNDMTAAEIYGYEFAELGMESKGLYIFDKYFYEGSYIHLHGYEGVLELVVNEISENYIEVTHRMGKERLCRSYSSVDELIADMWSLEQVKALDTDITEKPDNDLWFLFQMVCKVRHNFDLRNKEIDDYFEELWKRCIKEVRRRGCVEAAKLSQKEYLGLIADNVYKNSWDETKRSIDNDPKPKAISKIIKNRGCGGGGFSYKRYDVGNLDCDNKGVVMKTADKREFKYSWAQIYDAIAESKKPKQIDIFSMLALEFAV
jgi:hypothetical protein